MPTLTARDEADAANEQTRATMAGVSNGTEAGREVREAAAEGEQYAHERLWANDPAAARELDYEMAASEPYGGEADVFAERRQEAARDQANADLAEWQAGDGLPELLAELDGTEIEAG